MADPRQRQCGWCLHPPDPILDKIFDAVLEIFVERRRNVE